MTSVWPLPTSQASRFYKIVVCFERRPDGGLRAWSDTVPGFVLSHKDVDSLLADIRPALEMILSDRLGTRIVTEPLSDLRSQLESCGVVDAEPASFPDRIEYVAHSA